MNYIMRIWRWVTDRQLLLPVVFGLSGMMSSGRMSLVPAAWFGPFFALWYLDVGRQSRRKQLKDLWFALWIGLSIGWYGATPIWGLAFFVFMGVNAGIGILPYLLSILLDPAVKSSLIKSLILPSAIVVVEWLALFGSPFGSFGSEAYSQSGFLPFLQLLSVSGMLGLGFVMAWFASILSLVRKNLDKPRNWVPTVSLFLLCFSGIMLWGSIRIITAWSPETSAGQSVRIAGITVRPVDMHQMSPMVTDNPQEFSRIASELHSDYFSASLQAVHDGAQIIVWPELAGIGSSSDVEYLHTTAGRFAAEYEVFLVLPSLSIDPHGVEQAINQLHIFDSSGSIVLEHIKFGGNFMEGTVPGNQQLEIVETPFGVLSAVICWDTDFPDIIAQAGRGGVDILISPAFDWEGIDPLHGEMAVFRGIENGMSVVRQADSGWSVMSDPYGRILSEASGSTQYHIADVPILKLSTIYPFSGNWLAWLCLIFLLGILMIRVRKPAAFLVVIACITCFSAQDLSAEEVYHRDLTFQLFTGNDIAASSVNMRSTGKLVNDVYQRVIGPLMPNDILRNTVGSLWSFASAYNAMIWSHEFGHMLRANQVGGRFSIERWSFPVIYGKMELSVDASHEDAILAVAGGFEANYLTVQLSQRDFVRYNGLYNDELALSFAHRMMYPIYTSFIAPVDPSDPDTWINTKGDPVHFLLPVWERRENTVFMQDGTVNPDLSRLYTASAILGLFWNLLDPLFYQEAAAAFGADLDGRRPFFLIGSAEHGWTYGSLFNTSPLGPELHMTNYIARGDHLYTVTIRGGFPYTNYGIGLGLYGLSPFERTEVILETSFWIQDFYGPGGSVSTALEYSIFNRMELLLQAGWKTTGYQLGKQMDSGLTGSAGFRLLYN